jgi:hypothetical protein
MSSAASTVSTLQSFPGRDSIPPACFYNMQGLAGWLNHNPLYKIPFSYTGEFAPYLIPPELVTSSLSSVGYSQEKVPLCTTVTTLPQHLALQYNQQLSLFQKIYTINSNAYINYVATGEGPVYYTFSTFKEKYEYNSGVGLVNKLYNFKALADAPGLNWKIPFPIGM